MLRDFVQETCNAPGSAVSVALLGAPADRRSFLSAFSAGDPCYYFLDDGTQAEWGVCAGLASTPSNTLTRDTVLGNTAGTTARLNFASAVTYVYNDCPALRAVIVDGFNKVSLPGDLAVAGDATLAGDVNVSGTADITGALTVGKGGSFTGSATSTASAITGIQYLPSGIIEQFGSTVVTLDGTGAGLVTYGTPFPNATITVIAVNGDAAAHSGPVDIAYSNSVNGFQVFVPGVVSSTYRVNWLAKGY